MLFLKNQVLVFLLCMFPKSHFQVVLSNVWRESVGFSGTPKDMGPIRIPKDMGIVWEAYHKGVPLFQGTIGCTPNSVPMVLIGVI